tara:strand:+ start:1517 stop:2125 length:609 start_codon:yes stop_codon:yes gene_type:complete
MGLTLNTNSLTLGSGGAASGVSTSDVTTLIKNNTPYKFIAKVDASDSSTVDCSNVFTASDGFSSYRIILDNLTTASSSSYLWMRLTVSGSVYTTAHYGWSVVRHEGTGSLASNYENWDSKWRLHNSDSNTGYTGICDLGNTAVGLRTQSRYHVASGSSTQRGNFAAGGGGSAITGEVDGFHIISSSPNFTSGTVRIYGVNNV